MADDLDRGDKVEWNASQGKTKGEVKRKLISETKVKGHEVKASKDDPQYLVESYKFGQGSGPQAGRAQEV